MVGISLLTLVPGVVGGSENYARELCRALARVGELEYTVFLPRVAGDASDGLPGEIVGRYAAARSMPGRMRAMASAALRPGPLRRELRLDRLDAMHFPLSVMLPAVDEPPAATTILDLQHEFLPENFSRAELAYRRVVYRSTARRSQIVIAISEHARETLIERMGLEPERVRTIHLAVDHDRFTPADVSRENFLLYPANRWPHKNHERLAAAMELLPEYRLVLIGTGFTRVSGEELVDLYRRAAAVVYPSLYEGFGQPPLEALACGRPAAVSEIPPLREVCGDAAVYFDPRDPDAIATGIEEALRRGGGDGPARAAQFTWARCAREHEEVYAELIDG